MRPQFAFIAFSENLVKCYPDERMFLDADVAVAFVMFEFHSPDRTTAYTSK